MLVYAEDRKWSQVKAKFIQSFATTYNIPEQYLTIIEKNDIWLIKVDLINQYFPLEVGRRGKGPFSVKTLSEIQKIKNE